MRTVVFSVLLFVASLTNAQCNGNWTSVDFDSFEYAGNCPYLIPGSVYHLTPMGAGFGPSYSGNLHLYLNFQNGFTGVALDRPYDVCIGNTYQISFYHRDAWGGTNNTTFNIYDGNGVLLNSDNVPWTGATWNQYVSPPITATTTILRLEVVNNQTTGNNDMVIDDMELSVCDLSESTNYLYCNQSAPIDLFSLFSTNVVSGGTWSGPSTLTNGDQGTFDPSINSFGVYTYSVSGTGCPVSPSQVSVQGMQPVGLGNDTVICSGNSLTLDAGAGYDFYDWSTTQTSQSITVNTAGVYDVTVGITGGNLVQNGDFEGGLTNVSNNFTTDYASGTGGAWGLLSNPGEYAITTAANLVHNNFPGCTDHTTGAGNMMVANGASTANTIVWSQTVNVAPNTDYSFSYWAMRVSNDPSTSDLQLFINGTPIGPINSTGAVCNWLQVADIWNSGAATSAQLEIVNQSVSASGNDFALDDISFAPLCISQDTIIVGIEDPTQSISTVSPSCAGDQDGQIHIDNALAVEYSFDGGNVWQSDSFMVNLQAGSYLVCSRTSLGCEVCGPANIVDPQPVILTVSNDTTICENGMANLSASAIGGNSFQYLWDHTADTGANQQDSPISNTIYTVIAENQNGCVSAPQTINVTLLPPLISIITPITTICPGEDTYIETIANGGLGGPYDFQWSTGDSGTSSGTHGITVAPNDSTEYTVTVSDGCESTPFEISTFVYVAPLPEPQFTVTNPNQCEPAVFEIINTTDPSLNQYVYWLIDGEHVYVNEDTIYSPVLMAGEYDIQMIVTSYDGCVDSTTFINALTVQPKPVAAFSYSPNPVQMFNTQVVFSNGSLNANSYNWWFQAGDPEFSSETTPSVIFPDGQTGEYDVMLVAISDLGCMDTLILQVIVYPEVLIYAPNAFTPDDDEFNQNWRVFMEGIDIYDFELLLYNRWGELIWESHDVSESWDGTYNGSYVQNGTYTWVIQTKDILNDNKHTYKGSVSVIR